MQNTLIASIRFETMQPLTFTHHGNTDLPLLTRGVDSNGQHQKTVFVPASQLRGRLRHESALAQLRSEKEKVKLETAYLLALGQDTRPQEDAAPEAVRLNEQIKFRQENPFLDLFGTWKVASRLYVSHLLPDVNVQPDTIRHIRRDLDSNEALMQTLDDAEQQRFYQRQSNQAGASKLGKQLELAQREQKAAKRKGDDALEAELAQKVEKFKSDIKNQKGEDESTNTKHLVSAQAIPAGITLAGKLIVQAAKPRDLQYLLDAFAGISQQPYFGAQRARGFGEVQGNAVFQLQGADNLVAVNFGYGQPFKPQWTAAGKAFAQVA
jgi:CRISPR type IV-associated protein Csf2